jgi:hypothetical protein
MLGYEPSDPYTVIFAVSLTTAGPDVGPVV